MAKIPHFSRISDTGFALLGKFFSAHIWGDIILEKNLYEKSPHKQCPMFEGGTKCNFNH